MLFELFGIFLALLVFTCIVGIHEWGHFRTAKWFKVKVYEFGIGIPPRLKKLFTDASGTEYTLNWLPIGGFVRLKGESYESSIQDDSDALFNKPVWQQITVLLAGIAMNFLGACVVFAIVFMIGTKPLLIRMQDNDQPGLLEKISFESILIPQYASLEDAHKQGALKLGAGVILVPVENSPAQRAGVQPGDVLLGVQDTRTNTPDQLIEALSQVPEGIEVTLNIIREESLLMIPIIPEGGKIGVQVGPNIFEISDIRYGFGEALLKGFVETKNQVVLTFKVVGLMFRILFTSDNVETRKSVVDGIGGPVAIGNIFVHMTQQGVVVTNFLILAALISVSLGVFNLLPFPALDGGRCVVVVINGVSRGVFKKTCISPRLENQIHAAGFFLLILLAIIVAYHDILRISV